MKRLFSFIFLFVLIGFLFMACSSANRNIKKNVKVEEKKVNQIKEDEKLLPGERKLVWSSLKERPTWITGPKKRGDFFVGISRFAVTEVSAREMARRDAMIQISEYLKNEIFELSKQYMSDRSKEDETRIRNIIEEKFNVQFSKAVIVGFYVEDSYTEKYVEMVNGKIQYAWKVFIKAKFDKSKTYQKIYEKLKEESKKINDKKIIKDFKMIEKSLMKHLNMR